MNIIKSSLFILSLSLANTIWASQTSILIPDFSPIDRGQHVVINIPQQRLFLYKNGQLSKIYPVAVGKALTQTNLGNHVIGPKVFNPAWHIPKSIQKERGDGVTVVPPGPQNPLGPVFVRLGNPKLGLGIHGTSAPSSVPGVRSHGCVRMKSPDALEFAKSITTGSPAAVIYQMAALNVDANNNLWLAAFRDPYSKKNLNIHMLRESINQWAQTNDKEIDPKRINTILKIRSGIMNCLTCAKGTKIKLPLQSLAWTSGSAEYTQPKHIEPATPVEDKILPSATEIEIDEDMGKTKNPPAPEYNDKTITPIQQTEILVPSETELPPSKIKKDNDQNKDNKHQGDDITDTLF